MEQQIPQQNHIRTYVIAILLVAAIGFLIGVQVYSSHTNPKHQAEKHTTPTHYPPLPPGYYENVKYELTFSHLFGKITVYFKETNSFPKELTDLSPKYIDTKTISSVNTSYARTPDGRDFSFCATFEPKEKYFCLHAANGYMTKTE